MATVHLLHHNPTPTLEQVREGLGGNLCRCTGYTRIFDAVVRSGTAGIAVMRAHPSEYELVAPGKLSAVLELLAQRTGSVDADCRRN